MTFLRQNSLIIVFATGLVLTLLGLLAAICSHPHLYTATVLMSIGGSLIAASVTTYLSPVTEEVYQKFLSMGVQEVHASRKDIETHRWCREWLAGAHEKCIMIGIAHNEWVRDDDFKPIVMDRARHKVSVRVYFLDPTSSVAHNRASEDTVRELIITIKKSIEVMWNLRNQLEPEAKEYFKLYVYAATPVGTTWSDNVIIASHYLPAFPNLTSPALVLRPVSSKDMYTVYARNARAIEERAIVLDEANIHNYLPVQAEQN